MVRAFAGNTAEHKMTSRRGKIKEANVSLIRLTGISLTLLIAITGCAIKSNVSVPPITVKELSTNEFSTPITIEYLFDRGAFDFPVEPSGAGTIACSFQIHAATAVYAALNAVNRHSFRNIVGRGTARAYHIQIRLETFDVNVIEGNESHGVTAQANATIEFSVAVFNPDGVELGRREVRGEGEDEQSLGSCLGGKAPLMKAIQNALASMAREYQRRIIQALKLPH